MATANNLTSAEITALLWEHMGSSATNDVWWSVAAVVVQAVVVAMVISKAIEYYEHFFHIDCVYVLEIVGLGTALCVGALAVKIVELYKLVYHAADSLQVIMHFVAMVDVSNLLVGTIFGFCTGSYYVHRAYMMSRRNWYFVPPFAMALFGQLAVSLLLVITGFKALPFSIDAIATIMATQQKLTRYYRIWAAVTLAVDGCLCVFMAFCLVRSKQSIFHNEEKVFRRLISLLWETMLPPVICLLVLEIGTGGKEFSLTDWPKVLIFAIHSLYFHSALHTLVARHAVRKILDHKLAEAGVDRLTGTSQIGNGGVYVSHFTPMAKEGADEIMSA